MAPAESPDGAGGPDGADLPGGADLAAATRRPPLWRRLRGAAWRLKRDLIGPGLRAARFHAGLTPHRAPRLFCIAMQRTGTTSLGRFCADQLGLAVCEFDRAIANDWPRLWLSGRRSRIYAAADFRSAEVFVDDPWWYPRAYEELAPRFPEARFVLVTREPAAWFRSMMAHSRGRSPGHTELHAAVYGREAEFAELVARAGAKRRVNWQGLSLAGHEAHYTACYLRHAEAARRWFAAHAPDRFLELDLDDPEKFLRLAEFLGYPGGPYRDVHANASAAAAADGATPASARRRPDRDG